MGQQKNLLGKAYTNIGKHFQFLHADGYLKSMGQIKLNLKLLFFFLLSLFEEEVRLKFCLTLQDWKAFLRTRQELNCVMYDRRVLWFNKQLFLITF